jgi:predicted alpha/beta superfamily hydrolase
MYVKILTTLILLTVIRGQSQNLPKVASGTIIRVENFQSGFVDPRNVDIWLPDGYDPHKKYNVVYMHDGQMLFDSAKTWNHQAWDIDDVAGMLMEEGRVKKFIVVGIWNGVKSRYPDYFPQKPYESFSPEQKAYIAKKLQDSGKITGDFKAVSDNYLKFLVTELKPFIDKNYSTFSGRKHTFISGSSMGGLISIYAICEYPGVFGGAACLSTHWPGIHTMENNPVPEAMLRYLTTKLPDPGRHKIYFDYGDQTLDAMYPPLQQAVDEVMKARGFSSKNWQTQFFPGKDHSEKSWKERLSFPLLFLLGK